MNQELPKPLREALAGQTAGDVHPSPDALTAFVEHSLPSRESQRLTDHLAKCADCREIVFLASSALEEPVGEDQEWMPDAAVPRISPALKAKNSIPRILASADPDAEPVATPASPRRRWLLRWAWVPAVAVVVLVSAVLLRRTEFVNKAQQSSMTIASKGPLPSATDSQQAPTVAPQPESEAKVALQKPFAKSERAHTNSAQTSDALTSTLVASKAAEHYASAPLVTATPKPLSAPPPETISGAYKSAPAALPRQNAFVESQAQNASGLAAESRLAPEKPPMGLLPAIAARRQWRVTPDGHLERSTTPGNWTPVLADERVTFHVVSVVGDNVWVGGSGGVLFHSSDSGQNWKKELLSSPSGAETGTIVSIRFGDVLQGVITTEGGSQWNTSDGGLTWMKE